MPVPSDKQLRVLALPHRRIPRHRSIAIAIAVLAINPFTATTVTSHEVRPAFLQITERASGRYDVLWKQPTMGEVAVHLAPQISGDLLAKQPSTIEAGPGFMLRSWRDIDAGANGMEGRTLHIDGLDRTITEVLVSVTLSNGDVRRGFIRPDNPTMTLHLRAPGVTVPAYLLLGIEHILTGIDHLCFVLGLVLLVNNIRALITTITAFTVAHSLTLAATALRVMAPRPAAIEMLVALSIIFVAVELTRSLRGYGGVTARYPWLIAFLFGLLHGSAFASALATIGLPRNALPSSLLLFNLGVELGQLLFVVAILGTAHLLKRFPRALPHWTLWVPPYAIGSFATCWFLQRLGSALG